MKELIKKTAAFIDFKSDEMTVAISVQITVAIIGFIASKSKIFGLLFPFGISYVSAVPAAYIPAAAVGVFVGYFIPAVLGGNFRYVAAMLAVVAIRMLLSSYKQLVVKPLFFCLVAALSMSVTAPVMIKQSNFLSLSGEIILCAALTYCIRVCFKAGLKSRAGLLPHELGCLLTAVGFLLLGLSGIKLYGITLSNAVSVFLILAAAKYGGIIASSLVGISAAFASGVSGSAEIYYIYAFLGLICGVFSLYGKYAEVLSAVATAVVGMALTKNFNGAAGFATEIVIGGLAFLLLPKSVNTAFGRLLSLKPQFSLEADQKKLMKIKLLDLSEALTDVSATALQVSNRLSKMNAPEFDGVIKQIEQTACKGCKLRIHCWESKHEETVGAANSVIDGVKTGTENILPEEFRDRCIKLQNFKEAAKKEYADYAERKATENRISEIRDVVSEQFSGLSQMLKVLSSSIENNESFDETAAATAAAALKSTGVFPQESVAVVDKYGRMTVKLKARADKDTVINKMRVMHAVETALGRRFDVPVVTGKENDLFIALFEAPNYKISVGSHRITAAGSNMCGDSFKYFPDGQGRFFVVLSDGMGTGGAAAVDSAMATDLMSRLIKSGFDFSCALKVINSSMLFKSSDESLATLDICCLDTHTGKAEIYKAGAAPTVVRRGGRTGVAKGTTLPVGILSEVAFDKAQIYLKSGDIVLMMSDGAICDGTDWIKRELENFDGDDLSALCESVALSARRRRTDDHEDDITVIAVSISKTVK